MKHGSTTSLQSQISSQLWVDSSRWKSSKMIKDANISRQGFVFHILGSATYFVHWLPWERKKNINSEYYIVLLVHLKEEIAKKNSQKGKRKSALSPRQCTVSQVNHNDGKTTWIAFWIACAPTLFSRSGPQWLLAVCRPPKECSSERDLAPMKKGYRKLRCILTNSSTKKNFGISVSPQKETWWIKLNFA